MHHNYKQTPQIMLQSNVKYEKGHTTYIFTTLTFFGRQRRQDPKDCQKGLNWGCNFSISYDPAELKLWMLIYMDKIFRKYFFVVFAYITQMK